jgi:hypothetical protein
MFPVRYELGFYIPKDDILHVVSLNGTLLHVIEVIITSEIPTLYS